MMIEWLLEQAKRWASNIHEDNDTTRLAKLAALTDLREHVIDLINAIREDIRREAS